MGETKTRRLMKNENAATVMIAGKIAARARWRGV
jgi:hypothetical protein